MAASWSINKHVKGYCILFLLLETGMLGVFMALDFFLFYVFWEVMLLPMYFLIGVWGGPRREYAAIKFFLYTLVGSVLMLIAILMLYFASDLRQLNDGQLVASHAVTAASPNTNAPTMLTAEPIALGSRTPASFKMSKRNIIRNASINDGNGIPSCPAIIVNRSLVGVSSWWKTVPAAVASLR